MALSLTQADAFETGLQIIQEVDMTSIEYWTVLQFTYLVSFETICLRIWHA